jgi:hypothetical protein
VAGFLIAVTAYKQSEQIEVLAVEGRESLRKQREAAGMVALRLMLQHRCEGLRDYRLELYVLDHTTGRLAALASSNLRPSETQWEIMKGATGYAFGMKERVVVRGAGVYDSYAVPKERQERYRAKGTAIVVAMPVTNLNNRAIGVLTADGAADTGYFDRDAAYDEHLSLALDVARILIDLCERDSDDPEEPHEDRKRRVATI